MALLKPDYLRKHPIRSGLVFAAMWTPLMGLAAWWTASPKLSLRYPAILVPCGILAGLLWGYSMKAYHDRNSRP